MDATAYEVPAGHRLRVVLARRRLPPLGPLPAGPAPPGSLPFRQPPHPAGSEVRDVSLPEQPAYLLALLATLRATAGGSGPAIERCSPAPLTLTAIATGPAEAEGGRQMAAVQQDGGHRVADGPAELA